MNAYKLSDLMRTSPDVSVKAALEVLASMDPVVWVMFNRRLKGHPYSFDVSSLIDLERAKEKPDARAMQHMLLRHRPFLIQPMCDMHKHKVYKKGRQVGVSELSVSEVLHFLETHEKTKWIYTFPRDTQLKDFSITRIGETMEESPRMKHLFGIPNQVYMKKIGESSYLILRSAWESNLGEGVDADGVTFDEKDRMKEGIEVAFRESLSSSKYGLLREVSTPTIPGRGVDAPYGDSCQFEWFVKCESCSLEQIVDYPDNIIQMRDIPVGCKELAPGTYEYRCRKERCRGYLDRVHGRWIAKYPERTGIHGYWIPQTICPWINATDVMQKLINYKFRSLWENYVLGRTSIGENILLSEVDLLSCDAGHEQLFSRTPDYDHITAGIDWGHENWVVILGRNVHNGKKYIIGLAMFEDDPRRPLEQADRIAQYVSMFDPNVVVADDGYGKDRNVVMHRKFGDGRFYACLKHDTKVATLDARGWKHIRNIKPGDWTYVWDGQKVVPTRINAVFNQGKKKTVKVTVKDGNGRLKTFITTPDHVFMLREGGECAAGDLTLGNRLVPFGRWEVANGKYRQVNLTNVKGDLHYEHRLVGGEKHDVIHHLDHNGLNNSPDNLQGLTYLEHAAVHPLKMSEYPKFMEALRVRNASKEHLEAMVRYTHTAKANAKRVVTRAERGWYKEDRKEENHVVVSVEEGETESVWDISVEHPAHNFALHDGVFVHNCRYNPSEKGAAQFKPSFSDQGSRVLVDRTSTLKNTCRAVKLKEIGFPRYDRSVQLLHKHFLALAPTLHEEDGEIYELIEKTGPDHFVHSLGYCLIGHEKLEANVSSFSFSFE